MSELARELRMREGSDPAMAFGAGALTVAVLTASARIEESWATFPELLLVAIPCASLFALALLPERGAPEGERLSLRRRPWRTAMLVFALLLLVGTLTQFVRLLGSDEPGAGAVTWVTALTGALAAWLAARYDSPGLLLLGLILFATSAIALVEWIDEDAGTAAFRNVLLAVGVVYLLIARALRADALEHSHVAVAVASLSIISGAILGILVDVDAEGLLFDTESATSEIGENDGWELVLVLASLGVIAYGAWQRYRGAVYPGLIGLFAFAWITDSGSLAGWPLVLFLVAVACLLWGLFASDRDPVRTPPPPG